MATAAQSAKRENVTVGLNGTESITHDRFVNDNGTPIEFQLLTPASANFDHSLLISAPRVAARYENTDVWAFGSATAGSGVVAAQIDGTMGAYQLFFDATHVDKKADLRLYIELEHAVSGWERVPGKNGRWLERIHDINGQPTVA